MCYPLKTNLLYQIPQAIILQQKIFKLLILYLYIKKLYMIYIVNQKLLYDCYNSNYLIINKFLINYRNYTAI